MFANFCVCRRQVQSQRTHTIEILLKNFLSSLYLLFSAIVVKHAVVFAARDWVVCNEFTEAASNCYIVFGCNI